MNKNELIIRAKSVLNNSLYWSDSFINEIANFVQLELDKNDNRGGFPPVKRFCSPISHKMKSFKGSKEGYILNLALMFTHKRYLTDAKEWKCAPRFC